MSKHYMPEDFEYPESLDELYALHVNAMTAEKLHSKHHIAWELARRNCTECR